MTGSLVAAGSPSATPDPLPPLVLDQLRSLIDGAGIVQHARWTVPLRSSGYCVDDVARLAQVARLLTRRSDDPAWPEVERRAIAFLWHAADDAPTGMRNLMGYDRHWLDEPSGGDHVGRTIWAIAELLGADPHGAMAAPAEHLALRLVPQLGEHRPSAHTAAYSLIGLSRAPSLASSHSRVVAALADQLVARHGANADDTWDWFEPELRYDNARLSQALIVAGRSARRASLTELGLRTLRWYGDQCRLGETLRLPGNENRRRGQPHPGSGDEQPLDAAALVEAELDAWSVTGDGEHLRRAEAAFAWFTGRNHLGAELYDPITGGCRDGLGDDHVNENQGAESTLAYLLARLRLDERPT